MSWSSKTEIPLTEAAHRAGMSWGQAWRLVLQNKLIGRKVGGRWWVDKHSLESLTAERAESGAPTS